VTPTPGTDASRPPTRTVERALLRSGNALVAGMDEVGRGALAGPVSVGVVVVDLRTRTAPTGLRDSKLLTPAAREALRAPLRRWGVARAVGHASAEEIDAIGIIAALRAAARRALAEVRAAGAWPDAVILDGSHDWLTAPRQGDLFAVDHECEPTPAVHLRVKADLTCAVVAAASVLAKCERDGLMVDLDAQHPGYGWAVNKGYAVPDHLAALRRLGPSPQHRVSWRLPDAGDAEGGEPARREGVPARGMMVR
jgi:ribonuclease HII